MLVGWRAHRWIECGATIASFNVLLVSIIGGSIFWTSGGFIYSPDRSREGITSLDSLRLSSSHTTTSHSIRLIFRGCNDIRPSEYIFYARPLESMASYSKGAGQLPFWVWERAHDYMDSSDCLGPATATYLGDFFCCKRIAFHLAPHTVGDYLSLGAPARGWRPCMLSSQRRFSASARSCRCLTKNGPASASVAIMRKLSGLYRMHLSIPAAFPRRTRS